MFDDNSDFMKGFETGIMMRTKDGKLEDYGCVVPEDLKNDNQVIFDTILAALGTVKAFLPDDEDLKNGF